MNQLVEVLAIPRSLATDGLVLEVVGALVVLWGVAGLSDAAIQKQKRSLTAEMTKIGGETVALLQSQRGKARWGVAILLAGFALQLAGLGAS